MTTQRPPLNRGGIYITFKKQRRQRFSVRTTNVLLVKTRSNWLGNPLPFSSSRKFVISMIQRKYHLKLLRVEVLKILTTCCWYSVAVDANWIVLSQAVASRTSQTIPNTYLPLANVYASSAIIRNNRDIIRLGFFRWERTNKIFSWTLMDTRRLPVVNLAGLDSFHATILLPMNV